MMSGRVLVGTGPLIAILSQRDQHHQLCVDSLGSLHPPLFTCWPVLTEALWLLRHYPAAIQQLLGSFEVGLLRLLVLDETSIPWIARFLHHYRKLGAQAADAALMYLADREGIETVFTLDRRDFSVYRLHANKSVRILPE